MAEVKQNPDGSMSIVRETDSLEALRIGGRMGAPGSNIPAYIDGGQLSFNIAGPTDTGGGLLAWQNNTGFDIVVTYGILDVTSTATNTCSASFGSSTNSTGVSTGFFSAKDVHSGLSTTNSGAVSTKVVASNFITGSVSSGTSTGLVARAIFTYFPLPAAGAG